MENITNTDIVLNDPKTKANLSARISSLALASIAQETQGLLLRMFADPYILEKDERASLVAQLQDRVTHYPEVSELRVLLGMALCVNLDAQAAIVDLRESVRLAPNSFIAQRSEEHTSELQSHLNLVCRLLLEKKKCTSP